MLRVAISADPGLADYAFRDEFNQSARTNLCTNPAAVTDTTGWTNSGLTTFERVTSLPTTTGLPTGVTTGFHCVGNTADDNAQDTIALTAGATYRFSAYVLLRYELGDRGLPASSEPQRVRRRR